MRSRAVRGRRSRSLLLGGRLLVGALIVACAACATPPLRLSPRFTVGATRTYDLATDAVTSVKAQTLTRTERTQLRATSTLEVLSLKGDEATLRLTLTPTSLTRDGSGIQPPAAQTVELVAGPDGSVVRVLTVGGLPASISGTDLEDLAPVVGIPLPTQRVRLGAPLPRPSGNAVPQVYRGRVASVEVIDGYDCAVVELGTRRAISRQRTINEQQVRLEGDESAHSRIAFAFREGFPVRITTDAEGVFGIAGVAGSAVTIQTHTTLRLRA